MTHLNENLEIKLDRTQDVKRKASAKKHFQIDRFGTERRRKENEVKKKQSEMEHKYRIIKRGQKRKIDNYQNQMKVLLSKGRKNEGIEKRISQLSLECFNFWTRIYNKTQS